MAQNVQEADEVVFLGENLDRHFDIEAITVKRTSSSRSLNSNYLYPWQSYPGMVFPGHVYYPPMHPTWIAPILIFYGPAMSSHQSHSPQLGPGRGPISSEERNKGQVSTQGANDVFTVIVAQSPPKSTQSTQTDISKECQGLISKKDDVIGQVEPQGHWKKKILEDSVSLNQSENVGVPEGEEETEEEEAPSFDYRPGQGKSYKGMEELWEKKQDWSSDLESEEEESSPVLQVPTDKETEVELHDPFNVEDPSILIPELI